MTEETAVERYMGWLLRCSWRLTPATPHKAPKAAPKAKKPFVRCKVCGRRFHGLHRAQKLGSHNYQAHVRDRRQTGRPSIAENRADELIKGLRVVEQFNALKLETRKFLVQYSYRLGEGPWPQNATSAARRARGKSATQVKPPPCATTRAFAMGTATTE